LIYPRSRTAADRRDCFMRASYVLRDCAERDVRWTAKCSLTAEGVARILNFLDPETKEAITLDMVERRQKESDARDTQKTGCINFGILLAFSKANPDDTQLRDSVYRAMIDHDDPENCVLRTTGFLDGKARKDFAKHDVPKIRAQIEAVLEEAAALGNGPKREFIISLVYAPLTGAA